MRWDWDYTGISFHKSLSLRRLRHQGRRQAKDDGILNYSRAHPSAVLSLVKVVGMRISAMPMLEGELSGGLMHFNWLISDHCQPEMESAQWLPRNVQLASKLETAFLTLMLDKANFRVEI